MDLTLILTAATLGLLASLNIFVARDIAYPPFLQNLVWIAVLSLLAIFGSDFSSVNGFILTAVTLAAVGFSVGGWIAYASQRKERRKLEVEPSKDYTRALTALTILAVGIFPLFLWRILTIAQFDISQGFFNRLREALIADDGQNMAGIGYYFYLCLIIFLLHYISSKRIFTIRNAIFFALPLSVAILFVAKGFVFFLLCAFVGATLVQRKASSAQAIALASAIFGSTFLLIIFARSSDSAAGSEFVVESLKVYSLAGLPALTELTSFGLSGNGENVFRNLVVWLSRLGFDLTPPPMLQPYVYVPYGTNVYTYLRPYLIDFGLLGVFFFNGLLGFISVYSYLKARGGSAPFIIIHSLLYYPLIMQFFDDQYFQLLTLWIYISVFLIIYFKLFRYRITPHALNKE